MSYDPLFSDEAVFRCGVQYIILIDLVTLATISYLVFEAKSAP